MTLEHGKDKDGNDCLIFRREPLFSAINPKDQVREQMNKVDSLKTIEDRMSDGE